MSTPKKSKRTRRPQPSVRGRQTRDPLPDLDAIHDAFADGLALVTVAHEVITRERQYGPEATVLRKGVEALDQVYDRLDRADIQLAAFRKKSAKAAGRKP